MTTKTAWRVVKRAYPSQELTDVALVYNEHLALRLKRYAAPWLGLLEDEWLETFKVEVEDATFR